MPRIWETWKERLRRRGTDETAQETAAKALQALRMDYHVTFGTEPGQRVLADLLRRGGVAQTPLVLGQPDQTAYQCGRMRLALEIVEMISADPEAAVRMISSGQTEELFDAEVD
ncbi:MAG: hypothetical protein P4L83_21145 [Nevskia sp.]|nr:hypothetical protein [Nevskia sp.]